MTKNTESQFREAERRLDELLRRDEAMIRACEIDISDLSARFYHYKNDVLSWDFHFRTKQQRGSEIQSVWVVVSMNEINATGIRVWTRAELFQLGKESRWDLTTERRIALTHVEAVGLGNIIVTAIEAGETAAKAAV